MIKITHKGETKTVGEWSKETGLHEATIRWRFHKRMAAEKVLDPVTWEGQRQQHDRPECFNGSRLPTIPEPQEARDAMILCRARARERGDRIPRNTWDLKLEDDVWAQCLIEVAEEIGGFTLAEIGALMGGLSRERIRQIEFRALRALRKSCAE